jgi:hypothetical protein
MPDIENKRYIAKELNEAFDIPVLTTIQKQWNDVPVGTRVYWKGGPTTSPCYGTVVEVAAAPFDNPRVRLDPPMSPKFQLLNRERWAIEGEPDFPVEQKEPPFGYPTELEQKQMHANVGSSEWNKAAKRASMEMVGNGFLPETRISHIVGIGISAPVEPVVPLYKPKFCWSCGHGRGCLCPRRGKK